MALGLPISVCEHSCATRVVNQTLTDMDEECLSALSDGEERKAIMCLCGDLHFFCWKANAQLEKRHNRSSILGITFSPLLSCYSRGIGSSYHYTSYRPDPLLPTFFKILVRMSFISTEVRPICTKIELIKVLCTLSNVLNRQKVYIKHVNILINAVL